MLRRTFLASVASLLASDPVQAAITPAPAPGLTPSHVLWDGVYYDVRYTRQPFRLPISEEQMSAIGFGRSPTATPSDTR